MSIRTPLCFLVAVICFPSAGGAQPPQARSLTPEVFVSAGLAHPFVIGGRGFGSHLNIGGGAGLQWRRLGVEFEANRTLGLSSEEVACTAPCAGTARSGLLSSSLLSANVLYFFSSASRPSAQFYLTGGIGALWSKEVTTWATQTTMGELAYDDTGLAINFGAGMRIRVTEAISLRPEFRFYNSVILSSANLSLTRFSIAAGYHW
jgi:opacity protein-like surface antigen